MTVQEIAEYQQLKKTLMGNNMFVECDFTDPRWVRFNELSRKWGRYLSRVHQQQYGGVKKYIN